MEKLKKFIFPFLIFINLHAFRYRTSSNLSKPIKIDEWEKEIKSLNTIQKEFLLRLMQAFKNFESILLYAAKQGILMDGKIEDLLLKSEHSFYLEVDDQLDKNSDIFDAYKKGYDLYQGYTDSTEKITLEEIK